MISRQKPPGPRMTVQNLLSSTRRQKKNIFKSDLLRLINVTILGEVRAFLDIQARVDIFSVFLTAASIWLVLARILTNIFMTPNIERLMACSGLQRGT
jgi:hypothetical protein